MVDNISPRPLPQNVLAGQHDNEEDDDPQWDMPGGDRRDRKKTSGVPPSRHRSSKKLPAISATADCSATTTSVASPDRSTRKVRIDRLIEALSGSAAAESPSDAWRIISEIVASLGFRGKNGQLWTIPPLGDRCAQRNADGGVIITLIGHRLNIHQNGAYTIEELSLTSNRTIFRKPGQSGNNWRSAAQSSFDR